MIMMLGGSTEEQAGLNQQTMVTFVQIGQSVVPLGIRLRLRTIPSAAAKKTYTGIHGSVRQVANQWISRQLAQTYRLFVAKQVLASKVSCHATLSPMPQSYAKELASVTLWEAAQLYQARQSSICCTMRIGRQEARTGPRDDSQIYVQDAGAYSGLGSTPTSHPSSCRQDWGRPGLWDQDPLLQKRSLDLGIGSSRLRAYLQAYRRLEPHRLVHPLP